MFFYYSNHGVPVGRFKNRVQWQGNISRWDGSIRLQDVQLHDSGTYECELRLLQNSSVFKSQTVLLVSPAEPRGACPALGLLPELLPELCRAIPCIPLLSPRQDGECRPPRMPCPRETPGSGRPWWAVAAWPWWWRSWPGSASGRGTSAASGFSGGVRRHLPAALPGQAVPWCSQVRGLSSPGVGCSLLLPSSATLARPLSPRPPSALGCASSRDGLAQARTKGCQRPGRGRDRRRG